MRAYQIYRARIERGQPGDALGDWYQAQTQLETRHSCDS
ncbi:MAG: hypothetical protein JO121_25600 [Deltaproteobacteria bacterium]|nr:hypothetical protein [Deltaproteobacteria bacterium]